MPDPYEGLSPFQRRIRGLTAEPGVPLSPFQRLSLGLTEYPEWPDAPMPGGPGSIMGTEETFQGIPGLQIGGEPQLPYTGQAGLGPQPSIELLQAMRRPGARLVPETAQQATLPFSQQPSIEEPSPEIPAEQPLPDIQAPGDLARSRAEQKLDRLSALRTITEGIGGLGTLQTKAQIMTGQKRKPFVAETLRRRESVAEEELANVGVATSAFTPQQQKNLMTERTRWLESQTYKSSTKAISDADKIMELIKGGGAIQHEMAARFLLRASGEQRLSDADVASVRSRAGIKGLKDKLKRLAQDKITQEVKDQYAEIARKLKIGMMSYLRDQARKEAESFARISGIAEEEVYKAYGNIYGPDEYINMTDPETGQTEPVRPDQVELGLQKGLVRAE